MHLTSVTKSPLHVLWEQAQAVGFTKESLRRMLTLLNLDPRTMDEAEITTLLPYVNALNARKFTY